MQTLLSIKDLDIAFDLDQGRVNALEGVNLDIHPGETVGLVGESGCGKSMLALSILGLLPTPPASVSKGEIQFKGADLTRLGEKNLRRIRGNDISMIFQEPMTALNPVFKAGEQVSEVLRWHQGMSRAEARETVLGLFREVGIAEPEKRYNSFPHQLSGGMRQRVGIAMALACEPELILADEPTTALDVTIQAHILELMHKLQDKTGTAVLFITHDLGLVAHNCSRAAVMYSGWMVEEAKIGEIFSNPLHPYTRGLLGSLPHPAADRDQDLSPVPGSVPELGNLPRGCLFHPRCPEKRPQCETRIPRSSFTDSGHMVKCLLYGKEA
ncbi:MAG: ABC transporter ATP-binding protein [Desulfonatronovibrionaceae bacterium]